MVLPSEVLKIMQLLTSNNYEVYVVGGAVRNHLLNIPVNDYDLCTSAPANKIKEIFSNYQIFQTNLAHETITVLTGELVIEITTYRGNSITEDLNARDFTVNAIAYNNKYVYAENSLEDINNNVIRFINGSETINADPLRILRAIRLSAEYNFEIVGASHKLLFENIHLLNSVAKERIRDEFCKILMTKKPRKIFKTYFTIFTEVIPEIIAIQGINQYNKYHLYDVYTHTLVALDYSPVDLEIRLALFFHDIGKANTFTYDESGGHFYNHHIESARIAKTVLKRLKFSKQTIQNVVELIYYHDYQINLKMKSVAKLMSKINHNIFKLLEVKRCDILAQNPKYINRLDNLEIVKQLANEVIQKQMCLSIKDLAVNGHDLYNLGLREEVIGDMLKLLLDLVIDEKLENDYQSLIDYVIIHNQLMRWKNGNKSISSN